MIIWAAAVLLLKIEFYSLLGYTVNILFDTFTVIIDNINVVEYTTLIITFGQVHWSWYMQAVPAVPSSHVTSRFEQTAC